MSVPLLEKKRLAADALFSFVAFKRLISLWLKEQVPLVEAFCIATSLHILLFPVIWVISWTLPWPKSPVTTTVIEVDLQEWLKEGKPGTVFHYRDPNLNQ